MYIFYKYCLFLKSYPATCDICITAFDKNEINKQNNCFEKEPNIQAAISIGNFANTENGK